MAKKKQLQYVQTYHITFYFTEHFLYDTEVCMVVDTSPLAQWIECPMFCWFTMSDVP